MDPTQPLQPSAAVSKAILVTLLALIATNWGFIVGIFARTVGHLTPYSASVAGAGAATAAFGIGMGVAEFLRSAT
ncbi:hypothetical protein [Streptomyces sp. NPDC058294]|uniref:hypothetical protein n=1 Tax=Streptomyces sp. NPDC058294 TaxID=3346430 RepID=UPI0036E96384